MASLRRKRPWMPMWLLLIGALIVGLYALIEQAEAAPVQAGLAAVRTPTPRPAARTPTPRLGPDGLPLRVVLPLPRHEYQTLNNCGPATTMMVLRMFGQPSTQVQVAAALRPNRGDKNVDATEMASYIQQAGLQARVLVGGDTQRLRRLVAAGIPVIVEQLLNESGDIAHFRLVRGYDQTSGWFITADSYYAPTYNVSYTKFERLWRMFNHRYMPVWKPAQADTVRAILGEAWDEATMYAQARDQAQEALRTAPNDPAWWLALGHSQFGLGNWEGAITAYQRSVALGGLTRRVLWYQWWPVTALNRARRHTEAITWADGAIASAGVYAEMRYERGFALAALERWPEARAELQRAAADDPNYAPARDLLAALGP